MPHREDTAYGSRIAFAEPVIGPARGRTRWLTCPGRLVEAPLPRSSLNLPRLFRQHDRDAVADRIGEFCRTRDQLLLGGVKLERTFGQRTDQDFQQLWIDGAFEALGRGGHALVSGLGSFAPVAYPIEICRRAYREAIRMSSARTACCLARGNGRSDSAKPTKAQ